METNPEKNANFLGVVTKCLTFAPLIFEQFTGQKVPQLSGTMAEIQSALQQLQLTQTQIINNQQDLRQRLTTLENSANNLTNQFKSLRLTHTKEQKQIEYNQPQLENEDY